MFFLSTCVCKTQKEILFLTVNKETSFFFFHFQMNRHVFPDEEPVDKIFLKRDDTSLNFQEDLKKVAFYASQFIDVNKQKNEYFSTLQALNSHFSNFQNQISTVANTLPTLTDEQRQIMLNEESSMLKEMRSIQDKLRYDMKLSQNSLRETERELTIQLKKEDLQQDTPSISISTPTVRVMLSNIKDNRYQRESTLPEQEPFLSLWKDGDDRVERNILMKGGNGDVDIQCKKKKYHRQKTIRGYR
jgi:oligoendopeptidase F